MCKRSCVIAATILFVLAVATAAMAADDPFVGTWKLNLTKSKYNPGPAPKSAKAKIESQENGIKVIGDGVNAEGKTTHFETTAKFDGKDYPIVGNPTLDTISLKKIDANTIIMAGKRGGKEVGTQRMVISLDGKTMTVTAKGRNAQGQEVNNTVVYEKQ